MSTAPATPQVPQKLGGTACVRARMLTALALAIGAGFLMGSSARAVVSNASAPPSPVLARHTSTGFAARSSRPGRTDWQKIKTAAGLRTLALAPHRTARFRAFAAHLGLSELVSLRPIAPGRCATAVIYLYNNLLDLDNAYPGENWTPLRRVVAKEPSIHACAPRRSNKMMHDLLVADHQPQVRQ